MRDIKQKRLMELVHYIELNKVVSLGAICEEFNISMNTVRRDISQLIEEGSIVKVHGGVMFKNGETAKADIAHYPSRVLRNVEGKARIGMLASNLVDDGDTVFIDSGTTTAEIITPEFLKKNVIVVSNSLPVFERLQDVGNIKVYALGGIYVPHARAFTGTKAISEIKDITITKAFLGASAVSIPFGVSNNLSYEIDLKRTVAALAEKVILMADHQKIGRNAAMKICSIDRLYALVTDEEPDEEYLNCLEEKGIKVIC